jgi:hypothetical protein
MIRRKSRGFFPTPKEAKAFASKLVFQEIERLAKNDIQTPVSEFTATIDDDVVFIPPPPTPLPPAPWTLRQNPSQEGYQSQIPPPPPSTLGYRSPPTSRGQSHEPHFKEEYLGGPSSLLYVSL